MALILGEWHSPADKAAIRLASRIALKGGTIEGRSGFYANWKPYCDNPVPVVLRSSPRSDLRTVEAGLTAPCRKCEKCRLFRCMRWRQRIFNEIALCDDAGRRTWFCTLTFSQLHLTGIHLSGVKRASVRGVPVSEAVEWTAFREVQKFMKVLRRRLGVRASFRYVCVPEYGELHGRLHYHVLIHETSGVILYRDICECWRSGFAQAKLVECESTRGMSGVASYVSKYIAKALSHRVRASGGYGASDTPEATARVGNKTTPPQRTSQTK